MNRYYSDELDSFNPLWLIVPSAVWAALLYVALSAPTIHYEPGVRHPLPRPYVPQCYATEWRKGGYCEFRPVKRKYRN